MIDKMHTGAAAVAPRGAVAHTVAWSGSCCAKPPRRCTPERTTIMDEEAFNLSLRKFLKMVGVSSQREIDQAVAKAIAAGSISGTEALAATMTLRIAAVQLDVSFDGEIRLQ